MPLGIDFGTTRTIVAAVDRGNYPVLPFTDPDGDSHEFLPSVVALTDGGLVFGFEALAVAAEGAPMLRSFKRALAAPDVSTATTVSVGETEVPLLEVLTGFAEALRIAVESTHGDIGTVIVGVPAHAHGAQRFLTLEAFRTAGFRVAGLINEPSAAGFEYTHRQGRTLNSRRTRVIIYDLGGGTFDASLVAVSGTNHEVVDTTGHNHLGGDDFDAVLASCALRVAERSRSDLDDAAWTALLEESREAKERLAPQSRRLVLDVAGEGVVVPVADFYEAATPLVTATVAAMEPLASGLDDVLTEVAGIYLVGGASGLPLVPRLLRERFGRRVHRSPNPAASTAIGLAIAADDGAGFSLTDRLSRGFGVFREAADGRYLTFDPILGREERMAARGTTVVRRRYRAAHNVGWFRFVEYAGIADGEPRGDIVPFAEVVFPFDHALQQRGDVRLVPVRRTADGPLVEETYTIDRHGMVEVRISDLESGYTHTQALSMAR